MSVLSLVLAALCLVESGNNPKAVGDHGRAIGVLQIHREVVADVNRQYHTKYSWPQDCKDPEKSRKICSLYLQMYGERKTPEQLARIWNGGPEGDHSKRTLQYAHKFNKVFNK